MPKSKCKRKNGKKGGSSRAKYMNAPKFNSKPNAEELGDLFLGRLFGRRQIKVTKQIN